MDRKAIRTDDQRLERLRLIEYNRRKREEKQVNDEKTLDIVIMIVYLIDIIFVFS
jgi:hypothetical protein